MKKLITLGLAAFLLVSPCIARAQISTQIRLNGVNVGESGLRIINNGVMECSISTSDSAEISGILATYTQSGTLYNVKTVQVSGNAHLTYCFNSENESYAKLMFWNSCGDAVPLRASIDFTQRSGINVYYYDADNRLLQVDKANGKSLVFTYDNMGNLLTKTIREAGENNE